MDWEDFFESLILAILVILSAVGIFIGLSFLFIVEPIIGIIMSICLLILLIALIFYKIL